MLKIRVGMFETNSSSTHVCVLASRSTAERWFNKELYYMENVKFILDHVNIKDHIIDGCFIERKYLDNFILPISEYEQKIHPVKLETPITIKEIYDLMRDKVPSDLWEGEDLNQKIDFLKYHYYIEDISPEYIDEDELKHNVIYNSLEVYTKELFFERWSEYLEYSEYSAVINSAEVIAMCWCGYEG